MQVFKKLWAPNNLQKKIFFFEKKCLGTPRKRMVLADFACIVTEAPAKIGHFFLHWNVFDRFTRYLLNWLAMVSFSLKASQLYKIFKILRK